MNKLKFYKIASISFLLLNILLVTAFFVTKPKKGHPHNKRLDAQEHFQLSDDQHELFLSNLDAHHSELKTIKDKQTETLRPYFYSLSGNQQFQEQDSVLQLMKVLEERKLTSIYKHLQDTKRILTKDQLPLFDSFLKNILGNIESRDRRDRPHKKK